MKPPITKQLQQIRKDKGLTQTDLAKMLNSKRQTITSWETCESNHFTLGAHYPGLNNLIRWADALGYEITLQSKSPPKTEPRPPIFPAEWLKEEEK